MSLSRLPFSSVLAQAPVTAQKPKSQPGTHAPAVQSANPNVSLNDPTDTLDLPWQKIRIEGGTLQEQAEYLPKLLRVMQHAQKAQQLFPNFSHRHYGAAVEMNNGVEATATNLELSRQTSFCDLRAAVTSAFNQSLAKQPSQPLAAIPAPLKVQTLFLVNANPNGERPIPCSDCQEWMGEPVFKPETKVISLEKDTQKPEQKDSALIRVRTVADMLPLHQGRVQAIRMTTDKPLKNLPLETSQTARQVLAKAGRNLTLKQMQTMLRQAKAQYLNNANGTRESGKKTGVCMMLGPTGLLASKGRFDWTTRWFEAADLRAVAEGFDMAKRPAKEASELKQHSGAIKRRLQDWLIKLVQRHWMPDWIKKWVQRRSSSPSLQAVAYYSDDNRQPPLASLGRMARRRGSSDTLILTIENDVIQCRTIADFMPEMYQTPKKQTNQMEKAN